MQVRKGLLVLEGRTVERDSGAVHWGQGTDVCEDLVYTGRPRWCLPCPSRRWILTVPSQDPRRTHASRRTGWDLGRPKKGPRKTGDKGWLLALPAESSSFHWAYPIRLIVWILWPLVITENTIKKKIMKTSGTGEIPMRVWKLMGEGDVLLLWNAELHMEIFRQFLEYDLFLGICASCLHQTSEVFF